MSKQEIFNYFYTNSANLSVRTILMILFGGLLISSVIFVTYWITYKGVAYNAKFNASLIIIMLISIVIMLMISSNIVISLGMVGALSIVRFRTAVKDSRDTVFIFWAISEGLSVGSRNFKLAWITTLFIAIVIIVFSYAPSSHNKYLMIIRGGEQEISQEMLDTILKKYIVSVKLRSVNKDNTHQEMIYELRTKNELGLGCINEISNIEGVTAVNWVVESGENVG